MVADKITSWVKNNKLILGIVFLALFLRLFRISSYMTFLGDEGRDALVWLRMVKNFKFTLIGPMTSIGNMYLGPLFYYLMLPFYILMGTTGPSIGTALFAGATTFFLWYFGREWFSPKVGLAASLLYAVSPVAIVLSRSSWNPNVMPFFALLIIWGIWQFWQKDKYYWLAVEGVLLSFAIQSHYLGILLVPVVGIFFIIKLILLCTPARNASKISDQSRIRVRRLVLACVAGGLSFALLTVLPLIWFDLRHNFINYKSFYKFFSERQTTVNLKAYKAIPQIWPLWQNLVTRLLAGKNEIFGFWISIFTGSFLIVFIISCLLVYRDKQIVRKTELLLSLWLIIGLTGMGLYKQHIYDHYFGFLYPAVFLIFAVILETLSRFKKLGKFLTTGLFLLVLILSLIENPLKYPPSCQMEKTAEISQKIAGEAQSQPFNLGLIAKQNYDAGYRYFLEKWGKKAVEIDAQKADETITDQLFVVCEIQDCQPVGHPQAEIANFGWSKIEQEWEFPWGTKLFKLVRY